MTDKEKVISVFDGLRQFADMDIHPIVSPDNWLAYSNLRDAIDVAEENIIALLKEQEPRVLTLEELKQFVGHPCWFESSGTYMGKEGFWIIPSMFRTFNGSEIVSYVSVLMKNSDYGIADHGELGLSAYNKVWRCWTSRPTDEQRKAVK